MFVTSAFAQESAPAVEGGHTGTEGDTHSGTGVPAEAHGVFPPFDPATFPSLKDACKTATCPNPAGDLLGDGVDQNDKSFLSTFPYLPATDSGFDSRIKRENVPSAP